MNVNGTQNLDIPYSVDFDLSVGDFAVMSWIKTTSVQDDIIGAFGSGSPFTGFAFSIWTLGEVAIYIDGLGFITFNLAVVNDGNKHHIAVVNRSGTLYCYVDGVFVQSVAGGNPTGGSNQTIRIGRDSNAAPSRWYNGDFVDTRLYKNKTITDSDIKTIYTSRGNDNITDGLVLRVTTIGKTSGTAETATMFDISGNGNNATPVNGPTYTAETVKTNKRRVS